MADQTNQNQRFNIDSFRSNLSRGRYQKTTDFTMLIDNLPSGLENIARSNPKFNETIRDLVFRVEMSSVPGVSMATQEIRRHGVGAFEMKPYVPVFAPHDIMVIGDGDGWVHEFFQTWMNLIVNFDSRTQSGTSSINSRQTWYEVSYKESYQTNLTFVSYNNIGDEIIKVHLLKAYPIFLAPVEMSWSSMNNLVKFPVSFSYFDWYAERSPNSRSSSSIASTNGSNGSYVGPAQDPNRSVRPDGGGS